MATDHTVNHQYNEKLNPEDKHLTIENSSEQCLPENWDDAEPIFAIPVVG